MSGQHISGRKTSPMTASDAARLAAQQSRRGKITVPLGEEVKPTQEQKAVLAQIANGLGPKSSGPQMAGAAPVSTKPTGYPPTATPRPSNIRNYEQGRAPNRSRR